MMGYIRVIAAVVPPLFLIWYIYKLDAIEKEPRNLLTKLFFLGCLSVVPAVILEILLEGFLGSMFGGQMYLILENFIGIALVEEACKFFFLYFGTWKNREFDYRFDGIVYAVATSLGFAALENIGYVMTMSSGLELAIMRALTSIHGHCIFGIWMGYYYAKAKVEAHGLSAVNAKTNLRKAVLIPMLLHGAYDYLCTSAGAGSLALFAIYDIALVFFSFRKVKEFAKADAAVHAGAAAAFSGDDVPVGGAPGFHGSGNAGTPGSGGNGPDVFDAGSTNDLDNFL